MNEKQLYELAVRISSITVFTAVKESAPVRSLVKYLLCRGGEYERASAYAGFVSSLSDHNYSLSDFLSDAALCDKNAYTVCRASNAFVSAALEKNARADLCVLSDLTKLTAKELYPQSGAPYFENEPADLSEALEKRLANIGRYGYGMFARSTVFRLSDAGLIPVKNADGVRLSDLIGYEEERRLITENTKALLDGRPCANALLYGDAGTGKSSTVKACVNEFSDRGLRLIELRRDQLLSLPSVIDVIKDEPLKFIIFTDDLSFSGDDDGFVLLKAALEGSSAAISDNAAIYATSNRRHIVKESFSDRDGDDVHINDTVQELVSLSDRFGLRVLFGKPDKRLYLKIVRGLAERYGAGCAELDEKAEAFALAKGGRSPRAARQFIAALKANK